jgi:SHS2 domain-containing protein
MTSPLLSGYREVPHTADWELQVWAPDLSTLLEQAASGMYHLAGVKLNSYPRLTRRIELSYRDPEMLLIDFLTELVYLVDTEGIAFDEFELNLEGDRLIAELTGAPLASITKEVKAVTYHNLTIRITNRGMEANIVFDV